MRHIVLLAVVIALSGSMGYAIPPATQPAGPATRPALPTKAYYSDDDGVTWYVDDATKIPPYQHNGKTAYRAVLFRTDDKVFVARLEGYDDEAKAKIAEDVKNGRSTIAAEWRVSARGMMVRRPKQVKWVTIKEGDPRSVKEWAEIMIATAPDGSRRVRPVSVEENVKP